MVNPPTTTGKKQERSPSIIEPVKINLVQDQRRHEDEDRSRRSQESESKISEINNVRSTYKSSLNSTVIMLKDQEPGINSKVKSSNKRTISCFYSKEDNQCHYGDEDQFNCNKIVKKMRLTRSQNPNQCQSQPLGKVITDDLDFMALKINPSNSDLDDADPTPIISISSPSPHSEFKCEFPLGYQPQAGTERGNLGEIICWEEEKEPEVCHLKSHRIFLHDHPPLEAVFLIELLAEKIFANLNLSDLQKCRLVCQQWAIMGSKQMQKKTRIRFCPSLLYWDDFERRTVRWNNPQFHLKSLTKLMMTSIEFPCNDFAFYDGCSVELEVKRFIRLHGWRMKELTIQASIVTKNLLNNVPNLQKLELYEGPDSKLRLSMPKENFETSSDDDGDSDNDDFATGSRCHIPNLAIRILGVDENVPESFIQKIIKFCPNLHTIR